MSDSQYPAHDLASELDDLSVAYARLEAERDAARAALTSVSLPSQPVHEPVPDEETRAGFDLGVLRHNYTPETIPPCRVCGEPLSIASLGGGPTVYACDGMEDDPNEPGHLLWKPGRTPADEHYSQSRYIAYRDGDRRVLALIDELEESRKTLAIVHQDREHTRRELEAERAAHARTRADLASLRAAYEQQGRALDAERGKREMLEEEAGK